MLINWKTILLKLTYRFNTSSINIPAFLQKLTKLIDPKILVEMSEIPE